MSERKVEGIKVYVRSQDLTPEIIAICTATANQPKNGIQVPVPVSTKEWKKGRLIGWVTITGYN